MVTILNPQPKKNPVRLKGEAKTRFRAKVAKEHHYRCDTCRHYAPLNDPDTGFNQYFHGHVSHIRHYSIGGGDTLDNVRWECKTCHDKRNAWIS